MSTLVHTEGIVIRTLKYGETSIISHILTRDHGMQSFIMGGVSNSSGKAGLFQIMNQLELTYYFKDHGSMYRIREAKYSYIYSMLPFEIHRTAIGVYMLELVRKSILGHESDGEMYDWIKQNLIQLDQPLEHSKWVPLLFTIGLTKFLGIQPLLSGDENLIHFDLREGRFLPAAPFHREYLMEDTTRLLREILSADLEITDYRFEGDRTVRKKLLYGMVDYFKLHLDHFSGLDSPLILEEILA